MESFLTLIRLNNNNSSNRNSTPPPPNAQPTPDRLKGVLSFRPSRTRPRKPLRSSGRTTGGRVALGVGGNNQAGVRNSRVFSRNYGNPGVIRLVRKELYVEPHTPALTPAWSHKRRPESHTLLHSLSEVTASPSAHTFGRGQKTPFSRSNAHAFHTLARISIPARHLSFPEPSTPITASMLHQYSLSFIRSAPSGLCIEVSE